MNHIRQLTSRETTWHMRETDCSYINNRTQKLLRVIYGFLRAVYGWLGVVASGLRYLRIVTSYLRKNQSVDNRQKSFDMSKNFCEL